MKIYLIKTESYNEVVFEKDGKFKMSESAPDGLFEGIDLYGENAVQELSKYFANTDLNEFEDLWDADLDIESLEDLDMVALWNTDMVLDDLGREPFLDADCNVSYSCKGCIHSNGNDHGTSGRECGIVDGCCPCQEIA